jgi:hypothetical protein
VDEKPVRELPCDICGKPCRVTNPKAEWAAHWACAILGKRRIEELERAHSATAEGGK